MLANVGYGDSRPAKKKKAKRMDGFARVDMDRLAVNVVDLKRAEMLKRRKAAANKGATFSSAAAAGDGGQGPALPQTHTLREVGSRGDQGTFTQTVMKYRTNNSIVNTDPRAALLKYHDPSSQGAWVGAAYAQSDPNRVLADKTLEQEEQEEAEQAEQ
jgi:hypothetical protein